MSGTQNSLIEKIKSNQGILLFGLLIGFSWLLYLLLALWFPIFPNFDRLPLMDIRSFTPSIQAGALYGMIVILLFLLLIILIRLAGILWHRIGLPLILGISVLYSLPLLTVYPINANDIYRYVIRGRIASIYGLSPYTTAPATISGDPLISFAGEWAAETSPYGPVWESLAFLVTSFSKSNLLLGMLLFKLLIMIAFSAATVVLWSLFRNKGDTAKPETEKLGLILTMLWAWNPALLLIFIVNGHNDVVMILGMLAGLLVLRRGYITPGFLLMFLGALAKPVGVLALVILFVAILRQRQTWTNRLRIVISVSLGCLILGALFFLPFGQPLELTQRLWREAGSGGAFSPAVLMILIGQYGGLTLTREILSGLTNTLIVVFGLVTLCLIWLTWRGRSALRGTADIFFAYIAQALNFRIWYAAWPYPWLLLDIMDEPVMQWGYFRLLYGFWFLFTSQLSVLIYGHIRIYLFDGSQLLAHILGVFFTFLGPLVLSWASIRGRLSDPDKTIFHSERIEKPGG